MPALRARCSSRSSSCPVARNWPIVRTGVPARPYSVISPPVSGWLISTDRPVYCSVPMPLSDRLPRVTRGVARPGSRNPPCRRPSRSKNWRRSRPLGASAMTNVPLGARIERRRLDDPAVLAADGDQLAAGGAGGVDAVDRVATPIEDELLAAGRALIAERLTELADDFDRQGGDGAQRLDASGRRCRRRRSRGAPAGGCAISATADTMTAAATAGSERPFTGAPRGPRSAWPGRS